MWNTGAVPELLSSFFSAYTLQGHLDLVEIAIFRDADNETDILFKIYKDRYKGGLLESKGLWMLVPLEPEPCKLYG